MKLSKFNEAGIAAFSKYLDNLRQEPKLVVPRELLETSAYVLPLGLSTEIGLRLFASRMEAARYLDALFAKARVSPDELNEVGVWAWLSLFFFDSLCPADGHGRRECKDTARYVPINSLWTKRYRHLLSGPYRVLKAHNEDVEGARILLCGKVHKPGDIVEQILGVQGVIQNRASVELATMIYFDPSTGSFRRGAAGSGGGSVRRLTAFLSQLDVAWDISGMKPIELLGMLPKEFERFAKHAISNET